MHPGTARQDEGVQTVVVGECDRAQLQTAIGADRTTVARHDGDDVPAGSAETGRRLRGPGEDLVGADHVERLQPLEGDDDDAALPHGHNSAPDCAWRQ